MDISVVIPVYNSADALPGLVERLGAVLRTTGRRFEIVFVDDGSVDKSWKVLGESQRRCAEPIVAIQLMRNYGQHNALMCGFRHARGRYIVTMDDDLQNPPEEIPKLLEAIENRGLDLVYGCFQQKQHAGWRNLGSVLVQVFYRRVFKSSATPTSFRIVRRELIESILSYNLNFTYVDGMLAWNTQRIGQVTVEHHARSSGSSGYSVAKLVLLALNLFTNFSLLPLQVVSICGLTAALAGFVTGAYYLAHYFFSNIAVPGFASTIIAILVLGGVQLLALGIMGEYLGRLHLNVNRKPQYTEREVLHGPEAQADAAVTEEAAKIVIQARHGA